MNVLLSEIVCETSIYKSKKVYEAHTKITLKKIIVYHIIFKLLKCRVEGNYRKQMEENEDYTQEPNTLNYRCAHTHFTDVEHMHQ